MKTLENQLGLHLSNVIAAILKRNFNMSLKY